MEDPSGFSIYDDLTFAPLESLGWRVIEVPWSSPAEQWHAFDAVVIRSTWDYQDSPSDFLATLTAIESANVPLFNSVRICRWNMEKTYLRDLSRLGVPIVPTRWLDRLDHDFLDAQFKRPGSMPSIVVKPTIGANSDNVCVVTEADRSNWDEVVATFTARPLMVQPFLNSIKSLGEYSLFYFGGEYSHAILKKPRHDDFRVQEEHGGIIQRCEVESPLLHVGNQAITAVQDELLYARVDLAMLEDQTFAVMELELIEPSLYFAYDDKSPARFASAFDRMMSRPGKR